MSSETARSTPVDKRRAQAVAGALAGLVVVIVLFAVFFGVKAGKSDNSAKSGVAPSAAAQPSEEAPSTDPSAADPAATAPQPANVKTPAALSKAPVVKAGKGAVQKVTITPIVKGTGPVVKAGQTITVNYVVVTYKTGAILDSSWKSGQPLSSPIGVGKLIKGFDDAIPGQRVGSRVQIDIPAALAYGAQQGDLRFVVDILAAQ